MNKTHVLVININNLEYTKNCILDLIQQDTSFDLTIIDQNSNESGTKEYYTLLLNNWSRVDCPINILQNNDNVDLNRVWNKFYTDNQNEYLCFLNNDVRITPNFISDGEKIFETELTVGCVIHATNNQLYQNATKLNYVFVTNIKQGWDFTIKRKAYNMIPDELKVYCGDDFLFQQLYDNNWKCAMVTSSPMIHYQGMSTKDLKEPPSDVKRYINLGYTHSLRHCPDYSKIKPTFDKLK
jgi:GT2 family glycosyltransferase